MEWFLKLKCVRATLVSVDFVMTLLTLAVLAAVLAWPLSVIFGSIAHSAHASPVACREATVGVVVGDKPVNAYVLSCQGPDGAWQNTPRTADCSQKYCREYRATNATVGGESVSAHGTVLWRPDEAWEIVGAGGVRASSPVQYRYVPQPRQAVVVQALRRQQAVVVQAPPQQMFHQRQMFHGASRSYRPSLSHGTGYTDPTLSCRYSRRTTQVTRTPRFDRIFRSRHGEMVLDQREVLRTAQGIVLPERRTRESERCGQRYETYGRSRTMHGEPVLY